ncbi:MAG: ElyC/SanA/YdcF family protein [bacterium]
MYSSIDKVPESYTALVLGAGLEGDGPSDMLRDRIVSAVELYKAGKVKKLIMSGDNRFEDHNEPKVMIETANKLGVPLSDMQADYAGRRTYDSCYRLKNIFSQTSTIIVTQSFHITRAVFTCESLGVKSVGFVSDNDKYSTETWNYYKFRDILGLVKSVYDLWISSPAVVGGEKIKI